MLNIRIISCDNCKATLLNNFLLHFLTPHCGITIVLCNTFLQTFQILFSIMIINPRRKIQILNGSYIPSSGLDHRNQNKKRTYPDPETIKYNFLIFVSEKKELLHIIIRRELNTFLNEEFTSIINKRFPEKHFMKVY